MGGLDRLENVVRAILPLQGIHAELRQGKDAFHKLGHALQPFHPSSGRDERGRHDLQLMLLSQFNKLPWIGLQGSQEVIDKGRRGIAGFVFAGVCP